MVERYGRSDSTDRAVLAKLRLWMAHIGSEIDAEVCGTNRSSIGG